MVAEDNYLLCRVSKFSMNLNKFRCPFRGSQIVFLYRFDDSVNILYSMLIASKEGSEGERPLNGLSHGSKFLLITSIQRERG
jgi:hypothetical protein